MMFLSSGNVSGQGSPPTLEWGAAAVWWALIFAHGGRRPQGPIPDLRATVVVTATLRDVNTNPCRTILPDSLGIGVAQVGRDLCLMVRVPDDETGGVIDIVLEKAQAGALLAQADAVRLGELIGAA
jgi:hypothetical protein